jgi:hypothetical protein
MSNAHRYLIKNNDGRYLQIEALQPMAPFDPKPVPAMYVLPKIDAADTCIKVTWTTRRALAARWQIGHQGVVFIKKLDVVGRICSGGQWLVGFDTAMSLMCTHGGHLVYLKPRADKLKAA